ncbi:MAG: tail fiber domain-containing protein [Rhodanobacteraceae bacterium]
MQKSNAPTKLTVVFASGTGAGPVNAVPLTPGATPGTASYQTGFTSVNMEPIASGGIPPFGADFNGLFKDATLARQWQQAGYVYSFDSTFAGNANIGGYPAQSMLMMGSGNGLWINKTDNNSTNPDATGASGWIGLPAVGAYTITTTGGTTTPDPSVLGVTTLIVNGALTSNAVLVLPLTAGLRWIIANNTTGAYTLTVQGASGSGVAVSQGSALTVFTDGTNYYAASANLSGQYLPINGTAVAATKLATARAFSITGLATATAINFDGTGNVTFNVTALNVAGALGYTPANDASVVHIAGPETITGAKQFNANVLIQGAVLNIIRTASDYNAISLINTSGVQLQLDANGNSEGNLRTTTNHQLSFMTNNTLALTLDISQNATFAKNVTVNGTGTFSGAVTATGGFQVSDRRLKKNIRKFAARPLHRHVHLVEYTMIDDGYHGIGSTAQNAKRYAPEHVNTFDRNGKTYYGLNYASMAYEEAMWAGQEVDRLTKQVEKLERALERAKIEPRKGGWVRSLLEAIW